MNKFSYTTKLDTNGNRKASIIIEDIGRIYAEFCLNAKVKPEYCLSFDSVLDRLKSKFGYRVNLKAKVPNVITFYNGYADLYAEIMDAIVYVCSGGVLNYSRVRYLDASNRCSTDEYFGQFVTKSLINFLELTHLEPILNSKKSHFNDDVYLTNRVNVCNLVNNYLFGIAEATSYENYQFSSAMSLSDHVCLAKIAAKQIVINHLLRDKKYRKTTSIRNGYSIVEYYNGFHFEYEGNLITSSEIICALGQNVPAVYNGNLYKMIAGVMFLESNKKLLQGYFPPKMTA